MAERQTVQIEVLTLGKYSRPDSESLIQFIAWATKQLETVPAEFRNSVTFAWETDYDGGGDFVARYDRPETDEEMAARELQEERYRADRDREGRRLFDALRAKYGADPTP